MVFMGHAWECKGGGNCNTHKIMSKLYKFTEEQWKFNQNICLDKFVTRILIVYCKILPYNSLYYDYILFLVQFTSKNLFWQHEGQNVS